MRILVSGASGLIGAAFVASLSPPVAEVVRLVRREPRGAGETRWDPGAGRIDASALEGFDAVVHLAGRSLDSGRWTPRVKAEIWNSRVLGTRLLAETLARCERPPAVLASASAMGFYGDRGDEVLTEGSSRGTGFLADLAREWEAAAAAAVARGIRVVWLRNGLVLARGGGALARMLPPFRFGVGGPIGNGRAWWSWIGIRDVVRVIRFAIENDALAGPVNVVAPHPVRNVEFARVLGRVLHRPSLLPVPAWALRVAFGAMADEALLASTRVMPARLQEARFEFETSDLEETLRRLLRRGDRPGQGQ